MRCVAKSVFEGAKKGEGALVERVIGGAYTPLVEKRTSHFAHVEQKPHNEDGPQQLLEVEQTPVFAAGPEPVRVRLQKGDNQQRREVVHLGEGNRRERGGS